MKSIRAAVARAPKAPFTLEDLELDSPQAGEVLVRLVATGVCHTDIGMRDQVYPVPQPIVLGHEGAGIVEALGQGVENLQPGDRVVMSFSTCGHCLRCKDGAQHYCDFFFPLNFGGSRLDGTTALSKGSEKIYSHFFGQSSFAEYAIVRAANVVKVPADAPLEMLGPLGCGIMTGAGAIIHALRVGAGQSIAIFGAGSVGLSAVMAARLVGASLIIAVDLNDARLKVAQELGATHVLNPSAGGRLSDLVKGIAPGGVQFSLDTTARPSVIDEAVTSLCAHGVCGLLGAPKADDRLSISALDLLTMGKRIQGIVEGEAEPSVFIPQLIELQRQGRFPFEKLIKLYPFAEINQAIHDSETGKTIKAVVIM